MWRQPLTFGIKTSWERGTSAPGHRPEITDGLFMGGGGGAFCPAAVPQTKERSEIIVMKREILFNKAPIFIQKDILSLSPWIFFQSLFFCFRSCFSDLFFGFGRCGICFTKVQKRTQKREQPVRFDKQHDKLNSVV